MRSFVYDLIHVVVVTLPLLVFGMIDFSAPLIVSEILSPDNIQAAFLRYWVPGVVGLLIPPTLIWLMIGTRGFPPKDCKGPESQNDETARRPGYPTVD